MFKAEPDPACADPIETVHHETETVRPATRAIEEKIAIGEYAPGKRLDEAVLLAESRLADALAGSADRLASLGLIELRPRRGAVVAEVSPKQLIEMFEVMGELEAMCSRLAARRITEAEQAATAAHQACKAAAESDRRMPTTCRTSGSTSLSTTQPIILSLPLRPVNCIASFAFTAPPAPCAQSYGELVCGA